MALSNAFALLDVSAEAEEQGSAAKRTQGSRRAKASPEDGKEGWGAAGDDAEGGSVSATPGGEATSSSAAAVESELDDPLVWIDCEMTGLDVDTCSIIEIAVLVSDGQLRTVREGPDLVVHQSDAVLDGMNEWCVEHHGKSGLTERVRASTVSLAQAEEEVLAFVSRFCAPGSAPLAGNSVHCDLAFLKRYMPRLAAHLSYRIVDVSSISAMGWRWFPSTMRRQPKKECAHTAKSDILESLNGAQRRPMLDARSPGLWPPEQPRSYSSFASLSVLTHSAELRWLRKHIFKPGGKS